MASDDKPKGFTVNDRRGPHEDSKPEPPLSASTTQTEPSAARTVDAPDASDARESSPIDFATFVLSLASSALMHLGELDHPETNTNLPLAKQTIDILGMLADKTRGNLGDDEDKLLKHLLYDLRLKYVETKKKK